MVFLNVDFKYFYKIFVLGLIVVNSIELFYKIWQHPNL